MHIYETKFYKVLVPTFIAAVLLLVCLNVFTPLRLTTDSIRYLNIVDLLQGKLGAESFAAWDFLPHGYPYLLLFLENAGLLSSATIVTINIISVIAGGTLFCYLLPVRNKLLFISFLLLSFISIKHITLPLADQLFTLALFAACYTWKKVFEHSYKYLLPAIMLTVLSFYLRTAAIVLPIGVIGFLAYTNRKTFFASKVLRVVLLLMFIAAATLIFINIPLLERKVYYVHQLELGKLLRTPGSVLERMNIHFQEMGELIINIPSSQISRLSPFRNDEIVRYMYVIVGLVVLLLVIRSIVKLKIYRYFIGWVVFAYFMMIMLWPFYDTRFLIPLIPVVLYLLFPFFHRDSNTNGFSKFVVAVYVFFGFVGLSYSAMLSVDKDKFLRYYGSNPALTENYRLYFAKQPLPAPVSLETDADPNRLLYLLYKYDK